MNKRISPIIGIVVFGLLCIVTVFVIIPQLAGQIVGESRGPQLVQATETLPGILPTLTFPATPTATLTPTSSRPTINPTEVAELVKIMNSPIIFVLWFENQLFLLSPSTSQRWVKSGPITIGYYDADGHRMVCEPGVTYLIQPKSGKEFWVTYGEQKVEVEQFECPPSSYP